MQWNIQNLRGTSTPMLLITCSPSPFPPIISLSKCSVGRIKEYRISKEYWHWNSFGVMPRKRSFDDVALRARKRWAVRASLTLTDRDPRSSSEQSLQRGKFLLLFWLSWLFVCLTLFCEIYGIAWADCMVCSRSCAMRVAPKIKREVADLQIRVRIVRRNPFNILSLRTIVNIHNYIRTCISGIGRPATGQSSLM